MQLDEEIGKVAQGTPIVICTFGVIFYLTIASKGS
jgi:hypothetical protein